LREPTAGAVLAAAHGVEPGSAVNPAATSRHGQPLHLPVATLRAHCLAHAVAHAFARSRTREGAPTPPPRRRRRANGRGFLREKRIFISRKSFLSLKNPNKSILTLKIVKPFPESF
jgi:hypothetical protein